jgi:hypothetical protein
MQFLPKLHTNIQNMCLYSKNKFYNFFKYRSIIFDFFSKTKSSGARVHQICSRLLCKFNIFWHEGSLHDFPLPIAEKGYVATWAYDLSCKISFLLRGKRPANRHTRRTFRGDHVLLLCVASVRSWN